MKRYLFIGFMVGLIFLSPFIYFLNIVLIKAFDSWSLTSFFIVDFAPVLVITALSGFVIFRHPTRTSSTFYLGVMLGFTSGTLTVLFALPPFTDGSLFSLIIIYGPMMLSIIGSICCYWKISSSRKNK